MDPVLREQVKHVKVYSTSWVVRHQMLCMCSRLNSIDGIGTHLVQACNILYRYVSEEEKTNFVLRCPQNPTNWHLQEHLVSVADTC